MAFGRLEARGLRIWSHFGCFNKCVLTSSNPSMGERSGTTAAVGKEEGPWRRVLQQVTAALRGSGLDVLAPLSVEWYNAAVPPALHLPFLGRDTAPFAILVGNSKAIWEPFISTLRLQPSLLNSRHPFNAFVKQSLTTSLGVSFHVTDTQVDEASSHAAVNSKHVRAVVYWDYDTRPGKLVAMQCLAHSAGVAFFDESSNMCVHPTYGPWFALRALVLFDVDPPTEHERPQLLQSPPRPAVAREQVQEARMRAIEGEQKTRQPVSGSKESGQQWKLWLAVRDAIQPDHPMRYGPDQIEYHYTHNKDILTRLAAPLARSDH